jgi:hypothetical protein
MSEIAAGMFGFNVSLEFFSAKNLCHRHGTEGGNDQDWPGNRTSDERSDKLVARNSVSKKEKPLVWIYKRMFSMYIK